MTFSPFPFGGVVLEYISNITPIVAVDVRNKVPDTFSVQFVAVDSVSGLKVIKN